MIGFILVIHLGAHAGEPTIVASASADVQRLTRREARQLFTLRRQVWDNGRPVQLVLPPPDSSEMTWLSNDVLGLPPDVYQRFLAEQSYRSGDVVPPRANASGVAEAITNAGDTVGVLSVVSTPTDPPCVPVALDGS